MNGFEERKGRAGRLFLMGEKIGIQSDRGGTVLGKKKTSQGSTFQRASLGRMAAFSLALSVKDDFNSSLGEGEERMSQSFFWGERDKNRWAQDLDGEYK